ncbi:FAD-dependent oxidoreductase [Amycolatopsis sp. NPDC051758]|uniref:FAD-dependent oxidoreductase n=1 Tax=Amycolatopsis sp. NPDC051758 TaxID=3363935 RepID=UPI003799EF70
MLGQPLRLGGSTLPNRLVSAPMERNYGDTDGHLTARYADYLLERARAGVGLVFTEATYVRADGKGRTNQLGAHDDSCVPPLAEFVARMHAEGALVGCELNHGGRTAQSRVSGHPCVAPSPVPCEVAGGELPHELTTDDVHRLVTSFADAAARCAAAGVDVLSVHSGHGYLVHQFLSPRCNHRTDEFADPVRFLNLVLAAIRERVPDTTLGIRFSAVEGVEDGLDAAATFALIERVSLDRLDFLDISAGSYEAGEWIVQSGEWEPGFLRELAKPYRAFGLPLGLAGRIASPEAAAGLVADGTADFVSLARALHADPAFAAAALGSGRSYRPCIACNVCIDNLGQGPVGCSVNPAAGEPLPPVPAVPEVTVVGAGPAGLTAARELALEGARVTLVDEHRELGGAMRLAAKMKSTPEFSRFLDWSAAELDRLGVTLKLGTRYEPGASTPVVNATGGVPVIPDVEGKDLARVHSLRTWLRSDLPDPRECVIWGADTAGMAVADTLAARGVAVLLLGAETEIAPESGRRAKILAVPRLLNQPKVQVRLGVEVLEITADRIRTDRGWLDAPGPVLVSDRTAPAARLADATVTTGTPRNIREAVAAGRQAATAIVR